MVIILYHIPFFMTSIIESLYTFNLISEMDEKDNTKFTTAPHLISKNDYSFQKIVMNYFALLCSTYIIIGFSTLWLLENLSHSGPNLSTNQWENMMMLKYRNIFLSFHNIDSLLFHLLAKTHCP